MKDTEAELSMSITEINSCLIINLPGEITDDNMNYVMNGIIQKAHNSNVCGAVLDFSVISVIDSYSFRAFIEISKALLLMDVKVVWAGLKPGVVCALMDLNLNINEENVLTALNLEHALSLLANT